MSQGHLSALLPLDARAVLRLELDLYLDWLYLLLFRNRGVLAGGSGAAVLSVTFPVLLSCDYRAASELVTHRKTHLKSKAEEDLFRAEAY